jgi:hypothetical protein
MINRTAPFILVFILLLVLPVVGQKSSHQFEVRLTHARKVGVTKPIRDLVPMKSTDQQKLRDYKKNKPRTVHNFIGRKDSKEHVYQGLPKGEDPLRQSGM